MIQVTRLDGSHVVLNCDLIISIEETPDTVVTMSDDVVVMVREKAHDLVERVVAFHRRIHAPEALVAAAVPVSSSTDAAHLHAHTTATARSLHRS